MSREIVEEQVAIQINICRDNEGREWYRAAIMAPYEKQLEGNGLYGEFVSDLVQTCERCIPLGPEGD